MGFGFQIEREGQERRRERDFWVGMAERARES